MRSIESIVRDLQAAMAAERRAAALYEQAQQHVGLSHGHYVNTRSEVGRLRSELGAAVEAGVPA